METKKRVGIYVRVSTSEQSTDLQKQEILKYVEARGWSNAEIYEDSGKSGTNGNRPELKRLLRDARERKVDLVVCWKLDRLFRSLKDLISILQEFQDLGIEFVSLKDNIDLTTAAGRLLMQIIGAMGEFEASLIRERVRAGLKAAKANGKRLGRPKKQIEGQVIQLHREGHSVSAIGARLSVSQATVYRAFSKTPQKAGGNRQ